MTQLLHQTLWDEQRATAEACLGDPFVHGLGRGTLDPDVFKRFVAQDAFFLHAFYAAYALASAKTVGRRHVVRRFHDLMGGVLDELELHRSYATSLGIDLDDVTPAPATRAYTDFLLRTAWSSDAGEIVAAMTPCMRLYAWLGQRLGASVVSGNPYRDWVETYASAEFEALAATLESLLDELAVDGPVVREAYGYAMRCERRFFAAHSTPPT